MPLSQPELWERLRRFEIGDPSAALPFGRRLARENGWSPDHAEAVVEEYRRFVYLCAIGQLEITPSEAVDQAWHLHLTYSRSYWIDLCQRLLGKPLHHEPTRGGDRERGRFMRCYRRTLASYQHEFDQVPPADIWPPPEIRFRPVRSRPVDLDRYWLVERRAVGRAAAIATALALPLGLVACAIPNVLDPDFHFTEMSAGQALGLFLLVALPIVALWQWSFLNRSDRKRRGDGFWIDFGGGGDGDGGCSGCGGCSD